MLLLQRYGGLTAPISGSVYSVAALDAEEEDPEATTDIVTLSPDISMSVTISVDESDILSLALNQTAEVTVSSVSEETLSGIKDLCKYYLVGDERVRALDHATLHVYPGEFVSIIGPSGSGKSTLMNIIG